MIAILDYGVGNLRSVYKAFETVAGPLGIPVDIVDRPTDLTRWRAVVLPGQGAFGDSVNNLRRQGLERPLLDAVEAGLPLLGICVGMQLLFDSSEEMGQHEGLHLIPGAVRRFPDTHARPCTPRPYACASRRSAGTNCTCAQDDPLLANVPDGAYAYFAHSYYCDASRRRAPSWPRPTTASTIPASCAIATPGASSLIRKRATPSGCASWPTSCDGGESRRRRQGRRSIAAWPRSPSSPTPTRRSTLPPTP